MGKKLKSSYNQQSLNQLWALVKDKYLFTNGVGIKNGEFDMSNLVGRLFEKQQEEEREYQFALSIHSVLDRLSNKNVEVMLAYPCCVKKPEDSATTISYIDDCINKLIILPGAEIIENYENGRKRKLNPDIHRRLMSTSKYSNQN